MQDLSGNNFVPIYKPLLARQLRLLTLISSPNGLQYQPIHVSLKTYNIDSTLPYLALSYCWGDSDAAANIYVDGRELVVTHNLYRVFYYLQSIQRHEGIGYWWIDAICINQHDLEERKAQMLMMRDIFHSADRVIVWLGEPNAYDRDPWDCVKRLMCMEALSPSNGGHLDDPETFLEQRRLALLLRRPYFTRLWMVQENSAAIHAALYLGDHSQPRQDFVEVCRRAFEASVERRDGCYFELSAVTRRALSLLEPEQDQKLLRLMCHFRGLICSDSRDKIYALLSICAEQRRGYLGNLGYDKPTASLYALAASVLIDWSGSLSVFSCVQGNRRRNPFTKTCRNHIVKPVLPSWAPDWRMPWRTAVLDPQFANVKAGPSFFASKGMDASATLSSCETELSVKGTTIDYVAACHELDIDVVEDGPALMGSILPTVLTRLSGSTISPQSVYKRTRESYLQALVRSISADSVKLKTDIIYDERALKTNQRSNDDVDVEVLDFTERQRQRWKHLNANSRASLPWIGGPGHIATIFNSLAFFDPSKSYAQQYLNHIKNLLTGRMVFLTEQGYLGLGPDVLQVGDSVHVLVGGDVLFALRTTQAKEYTLVGECYLHGFMDGSIINGDGSEQVFESYVLV